MNLKPWGDYKKSDYSVSQWHAASLIHNHDGEPTSKEDCKLPIKTPDGAVHPGGVQAAAAALAGARGGLKDVSSDQKASAAKTLIGHYKKMGQDPPDSLLNHSDPIAKFLSHWGVKGMKWGVRNDRKKESSGSGNGSGTNNKPKPHELSDDELKKHISRMELEKRYTELASGKHSKSKGAGAAFAGELGKNLVRTAVSAAGTHAVNQALKKVAK